MQLPAVLSRVCCRSPHALTQVEGFFVWTAWMWVIWACDWLCLVYRKSGWMSSAGRSTPVMLLKFVFLRKGNKVFMDLELNYCCPHRAFVSSSEFTLVKAGCGISLSCCCC